jgi:adenosylmethionine-8-amino-7-oxononanoate aminotransferase
LNLSNADKKFVWHPYTQMKDWLQWNNKVIVKGDGFYLIDEQGGRYLDGIASMWCNVWGHGRNEIVEAMIDQMKDLQHSTLFGLGNSPSAVLAEKLTKIAKGMDKVFYTDNGSAAIEVAMKMAIQYWRNKGRMKKNQLISIQHGYHGDTVGAMSVGYVKKYFGAYKSLLTNVNRAPSPLLYGSGFDNENDLVEFCIEKTEKILRKKANNCAALVMESGAQIAGGVIIYPKRYQQKVADLCRKYDVLLILDEIATGFGRLGNMVEYIAQKSFPDIVCFGKALNGGYFPIAVTLTHNGIFNAFLDDYSNNRQLYHGHTYTGHPVGCAAALSNIELYKKYNLIDRIKENAKYLKSRLSEFQGSAVVADIRHKGLLAGIELAKDGKPIAQLANGERINYFIVKESLRMGVHLRPLGNIMMIVPPLAIQRDDLEKIVSVQLEILRKIEVLFGTR